MAKSKKITKILEPVETYTEYCTNGCCPGFQVPVGTYGPDALDPYLTTVYREGYDYPVCVVCEDTFLGSGQYFRTMAASDEYDREHPGRFS